VTDAATLRFYDQEASIYAAAVPGTGEAALRRFAARLPVPGRVLEIGCGGGHDAAWMMARGLKVTATDASAAMAAEAARRLGVDVRVMAAEDLDETAAFDGIWAAASLLHVPKASLAGVFRHIATALVPGGQLYCSFKASDGDGEGRDELGRYYNYPSPDELRALVEDSGLRILDFEKDAGSGYDGRAARWLSVWAARA